VAPSIKNTWKNLALTHHPIVSARIMPQHADARVARRGDKQGMHRLVSAYSCDAAGSTRVDDVKGCLTNESVKTDESVGVRPWEQSASPWRETIDDLNREGKIADPRFRIPGEQPLDDTGRVWDFVFDAAMKAAAPPERNNEEKRRLYKLAIGFNGQMHEIEKPMDEGSRQFVMNAILFAFVIGMEAGADKEMRLKMAPEFESFLNRMRLSSANEKRIDKPALKLLDDFIARETEKLWAKKAIRRCSYRGTAGDILQLVNDYIATLVNPIKDWPVIDLNNPDQKELAIGRIRKRIAILFPRKAVGTRWTVDDRPQNDRTVVHRPTKRTLPS
jgi:hypothetical protein